MEENKEKLFDKWFKIRQDMDRINHLLLWHMKSLEDNRVEFVDGELDDVSDALFRIKDYIKS